MAAVCPQTFQDAAACAAACSEFPTDGEVGDAVGDTLQCRIVHAAMAADGDPAVHCAHAAPGGGEACVPPPPPSNTEPDSEAVPFRLHYNARGVAQVLFELQPEGDADWFVFVLDAPQVVTLETHAPDDPAGCNGDTILTLYDAASVLLQQVARNDDRAQDALCSLIPPTPLPAGAYLVQARAFGDGAAGQNLLAARLVLGSPAGVPCGQQGLDACDIASYCAGAVDDQPGVCTAHVCGDGVLAASEECDDANEDEADGCVACRLPPIAVGEPCERQGAPCAAGSFCTGNVCRPSVCGDGLPTPGKECEDGNLVDGDGCSAQCRVEADRRHVEPDGPRQPFPLFFDADGRAEVLYENAPRWDQDWFSFSLEAPRSVTITTRGWQAEDRCNGDPALDLYTGAGEVIASNDNAPGRNTCAQIVMDLEPGDYLVRAGATYGSTAGPNFITVDAVVRLPAGAACNADGGFLRCEDHLQCVEGVCAAPVCGDGLAGPGEACDDGDDDDLDGCTQQCTIADIPLGVACDPEVLGFEATCSQGNYCGAEGVCAAHRCGDGVVSPDETCDDGNDDDDDGCNAQCELVDPPIESTGYHHAAIPPGGTQSWPVALGGPTRVVVDTDRCPDVRLQIVDADSGAVLAESSAIAACALVSLALEAGRYRLVARRGDEEEPRVVTVRVRLRPILGRDQACDRSGQDNECAADLRCALGAGDGVGRCVPTSALAESEPNETTAQALAARIEPNATVLGALSDGDQDLFAVDVPNGGQLTLRTQEAEGDLASCLNVDTALYQVDPAIVDDLGLRAATRAEHRLAYNDDLNAFGRCSRLTVDVPPGTHYFVIDRAAGQGEPGYRLDVALTAGADELCSSQGRLPACGAGLTCFDETRDGDGVCAVDPPEILAPGQSCDPDSEDPRCATGLVCFSDDPEVRAQCAVERALLPGANPSQGFGQGGFDLWSVAVDAPQRVQLSTAPDADACGLNDTRLFLYRMDAGVPVELANNDDTEGLALCSRLSEVLQPGRYAVKVDGYGGAAVARYTLRWQAPAVVGLGEACDPTGVESQCAEGLACEGGGDDAPGQCVAP